MSKGLEDFKWIVENKYIKLQGWQEDVVALECANNIEQELKALEIIKEKNVWFWVFRRTHNVNEYNEKVALYYPECDELTQEEYELLKGVLL